MLGLLGGRCYALTGREMKKEILAVAEGLPERWKWYVLTVVGRAACCGPGRAGARFRGAPLPRTPL